MHEIQFLVKAKFDDLCYPLKDELPLRALDGDNGTCAYHDWQTVTSELLKTAEQHSNKRKCSIKLFIAAQDSNYGHKECLFILST